MLSNLNILIGRNNAGKSAVFGALDVLNKAIRGESFDWPTVLTAKDPGRVLEMRLLFDLSPEDRSEFVHILSQTGGRGNRADAMLESPLARRVAFQFRSAAGEPHLLHLRQTRLMAETGEWVVVQEFKHGEDDRTGNPQSRVIAVAREAARFPQEPLTAARLSVNGDPSPNIAEVRIHVGYMGQSDFHPDRALMWLVRSVGLYLRHAFFFNPFRHSASKLSVQQTDQLAQDGSNLAQVLHTINSNDRELFTKIEALVHAALPDVGRLQTPLFSNETEVHFRATGYTTRLHDMGGGIEQLLMIATVLLTTPDAHALFVEEPESHLHAGAQRFLLERLCRGDRQVFVTTHAPAFVNSPRAKSIYQVQNENHRTKISRIGDTDSLSDVLADIGSRNSDVLLSDAVLFVEGAGDRRAFVQWSDALGMSLEDNNITVLTMGGGEHARQQAPIRSDVLSGVSRRAGVPHLFVFDRDERSESEISSIEATLGDRVHFLNRRELENYLLVPRAILAALNAKYSDRPVVLEKIRGETDASIAEAMHQEADALYGLVLLKRIRVSLGGLIGGYLPRDIATSLAPSAKDTRLADRIKEEIEQRLNTKVGALAIDVRVDEQRARLDREWTDVGARLRLAPGEEILSAIFRRMGGEYAKRGDAERIASEMEPSEIADELKTKIIRRIVEIAR